MNSIDSKRALISLAASNTLGTLVLFMIPLIVGATAEGFGKSEAIAGIVSSGQLGMLAAASTFLATRYKRLNLRRWIWLGALVYVTASFFSFLSVATGQWVAFVISRGAVGVGEGALLAVSSGLAAQTARPDRTFAWLAGCHVVASVVGYTALPAAMDWLGPAGAFFVMLVVGVSLLPLLFFTPVGVGRGANSSIKAPQLLTSTGLLLLLSVGALNLGLNALFPFTERIGVSIGFTTSEVSAILSWGAVFGIFGPIVAGVLSGRAGRTIPLALGAISQIAAVLILVYTTSHVVWAGGFVVSSIALMYFLPLVYGLVAFYDHSGQINAAAASVTAWTSAAGPLVASAALVAGFDYPLIGWLTAACYGAMFAFAVRPARVADAMQQGAIGSE